MVDLTRIRIATSIPRQSWTIKEKLKWLDEAITANSCDLFLTPQEYFGGGSCREICRLKGIKTDDAPVTEQWLEVQIATLAVKHKTHIGIGASVNRNGIVTEDFLYYDSAGKYLGHHSKMALPVQDSILNGGASNITPETDPSRAAKLIEIPELGLRVGTVFCWQVFFNRFWQELSDLNCNLVVHPIKFAPRAWYEKGINPQGQPTRIGFKQGTESKDGETDSLGWIRKLKYESEFKQLPIAVTCNTWNGGGQYLALVGWVDETCGRTLLQNFPSTPENEAVQVTTYNPTLYGEKLEHLSMANYKEFIEVFPTLMKGAMRRKAVRIENRAHNGRTRDKLAAVIQKNMEKDCTAAQGTQPDFFEQPE